MTVEPLIPALPALAPDEPLGTPQPVGGGRGSFATALAKAFGDASESLERADRAEHAFAAGRGGLQEMVLERAQSDVALSLAGATASRVSQALSTILGMQI